MGSFRRTLRRGGGGAWLVHVGISPSLVPQERLNQTELTQPVLLTAKHRTLACLAGRPAGRNRNGWQDTVLASTRRWSAPARWLLQDAVKLVKPTRSVDAAGGSSRLKGQWPPFWDSTMMSSAQCCNASRGRGSAPPISMRPVRSSSPVRAAAVGEAVGNCNDAGARRAVELQVSGPFHCELMAPAKVGFAAALDSIELKNAGNSRGPQR